MALQKQIRPLPINREECQTRGWDELDIILVSGDAYIDHPSFGIALIGRLLEEQGYRVAVLSQPRYDRADDFKQFGRPKLFFGISSGNLDSIVANYSGNGKVREKDAYSPGGNPWWGQKQAKNERRRPDRACLIYANLARAAYHDTTIILGGVEASLRRFIHYDYKQERLRGSLLSDAKGDLLIYGMGERAVTMAAERMAGGKSLQGIPGSCSRLSPQEFSRQFTEPDEKKGTEQELIQLPSWQEISHDKQNFIRAERLIDKEARAYGTKLLAQEQQSSWIIQYPAAAPLNTKELDRLYELPFSRKPHPERDDIPAYQMIRHSLTIVRGCPGNCSFCAISRHQGPAVSSRSKASILRELKKISRMDDFKGTISDLGGPTANLYQAKCKIGSCPKHDCLYPLPCSNLQLDEQAFLELLQEGLAIREIKHLFISSGLRMALLLKTPKLLRAILQKHSPGALKIAPEHTEDPVLKLMHKEPHSQLVKFIGECRQLAKQLGKKVQFTPYLISAHPGSTTKDAAKLARRLQSLKLNTNQLQDFTPSPGTLSTAMYVSGLHPEHDTPIHIPKKQSERKKQRQLLERYLQPRKRIKKR